MDSVLAFHLADPGSILGVPDRNIVSPCSLYLLTALLRIKLTVQKLNNVDWSHLELLDSATKNRVRLLQHQNGFSPLGHTMVGKKWSQSW